MIDRLGLRPLVDATTTSEQAGSCKPDRRIFEIALSQGRRATPARALFVGDTPSHDVAGAAAVGMRTAWLAVDARTGTDAGAPDHVIHALGEVLDVVERQ